MAPTEGGEMAKEDKLESEGMGGHWQEIYHNTRAGLSPILCDEGDFVNQLLARRVAHMPKMAEEDDAERLLCFLTRFIDMSRGGAEIRESIFFLARSNWDLQKALERWMDPDRYPEMLAEEESENPEAGSGGDTPGPYESINRINQDVDRAPAFKDKAEPGKFLIVVRQLDGKPDKRHEFHQYNKGQVFDWGDPEHIRGLNRWRSQILRRTLGTSRPARIPYHEAEREWLTQVHRDFRDQVLANGRKPNYHKMGWNDITAEFNNFFEGHLLPNDPTPRPPRTKASLTTERYRIKDITDLTGLRPKAKQREARNTKKAQKGPEEGENVDEDKTEDEEEQEIRQPESSRGPGPGGTGARGKGFGSAKGGERKSSGDVCLI